ncbi:15-hydroxyprostaglandin dehydrogenase [Phaeosphaeria sp. MPI-PUGE-AT-0046c]|nr:15-hydroxyprostaglandin dehydrogenase [Phaeosphaeria sp. MPI-PUGE-AT-0046c]
MTSKKVALITGGASGMGLAVATLLSQNPIWTIHLLDLQPPTSPILNSTFHKCDVTDEAGLASIFASIYASHQRLDFVFANAGIAERANFYSNSSDPTEDPDLPVEGLHALIDINLKSVITTTYLAAHYMGNAQSAAARGTADDKSIVITASCGGLYPSFYSPIYTATKHAVVGFMRSIAPCYFFKKGIRVNAICPGTVKTGLLSKEEWANFPEEYFTPVEKIARTVGMLVERRDEDAGAGEGGGLLWGRAVEISGERHYYREAVEFCDEGMAKVMGSTNIEVLDNVQDA